MTIKTLIPTLLIGSFGCLLYSQVAIPNAPQWQVTFRVTGEDGLPIADANVYAGYFIPPPPNTTEAESRKMGVSDTNGIITLSSRSGPRIWYGADKIGYYSTGSAEYPFKNKVGNRWQPWNPTLDIMLRQIGHPIPMYARKAQIEIPIVDKPIGFDIVKYDWVAPYGKGKQSDFIFDVHRRWVSRNDFDSTLNVSFPNSGDGLIAAPTQLQKTGGPVLGEPAPSEGYTPELTRNLSNTPTGGWKDDSKSQNYYYRIRTVFDENRNVKSALYGKIYGDFGLDPINSKTTWILFTYYLNPIPDSRNVEFDPNQNLFKNLPAMQQVRDP